MKKVLLGTSAIALASAVAAPANANQVELKIGGFVESWIGFATTDHTCNVGDAICGGSDFDGVDAKWDGEIEFVPSITLDNGIQIGANIQLEGRADARGATAQGYASTPDIIDEAYVFIKGSFGEVLIGDENSAGYKMTYAAPGVTFLGINSPSSTIFVPYSGNVGGSPAALTSGGGTTAAVPGTNFGSDTFRRTLGTTYIENEGNNDSGRITYFTPRFAGFQVGVSYARDSARDVNAMQNINATAISNIFDIGANYVNSFGGVNVAVSGRWGIATDDRPAGSGDVGNDPTVWGAGVNIGFGGFTVGGSFAEQNDADTEDGISYDAGVSYRTGPWGFSFQYFHGENVNDENAGALNNDEERDAFLVGVDYDLAKGVDINLVAGYEDFDEEVSDSGAGTGNDVDGFYIATGVRLRF